MPSASFKAGDTFPACRRLALALCMLAAGTAGGNACGGPPAQQAATFPLKVEPGKHYLEDAVGQPYFMQGDTAWSLIAQLTRQEADLYLRDRKERGFNTILVNLLEHRFSSKAPANILGDPPFLTDGDYSTPNEAYFRHADWVLQRACELGLTVLLAPSYAGYNGGQEGWYREMIGNGETRLYAYGQFLGKRYRDLDNIVWVQGGDYNTPDKNLVRAIAEGIREADPDALQTAHGSPETAAAEYWHGEPWLAINNIYTYDPVHEAAGRQYARSGAMPFFLMESAYEYEHDAGEHRVRMQAYQALLSGASGQLFGNNPIWHFSGPGLYPVDFNWQQALDSPGARSMTVLNGLVDSVKWWLLEPDTDNALLVDGPGPSTMHTAAARASDGSFALVYVPAARTVTLDLTKLSGSRIAARWLDPSNGTFSAVEGSPFRAGTETLRPPTENSSGLADWVLELTSEAGTRESQ